MTNSHVSHPISFRKLFTEPLEKIGSQSAHNILNIILSEQVTEIVTTLDWMLNIAYGGNTTTLPVQTECVAK